MYCNKCGCEIPDGSSFCNKCGNAVKSPQTAEQSPHQKKIEVKKMRLALYLVFVIIIIPASIIFGVCSKPSGMSDEDYKISCKILDVTNEYLSGDVSKSEAKNRIEELQDRLQGKGVDSPMFRVSLSAISISFELAGDWTDVSKVKEERDKLKNALHRYLF